MIQFKRVNLGKAYEYVKPLIESGNIGLGAIVEEFEKELADYVGSKFVVATDSCTSALFLSLKWERLQAENFHESFHYVKIPSMTVPLVANACIEAGFEILFNDETDWVGSAYNIESTKVWDSAHQLQRNQFKNMGDSEIKLCFSFYPTKTIGSADGGAIATDDKNFYWWAKSASTYGRNMHQKGNSWDYDISMVGYKRHYTNLQAAICLEQLKRLDETNAKRQDIVKRYNAAFNLQNTSDYLYRINMEDRDRFIEYARSKGVECGVHFKPLHMMTPFKSVPTRNASKIEEAYRKTVSLPLYDTLTGAEVQMVIDVVKSFQ